MLNTIQFIPILFLLETGIFYTVLLLSNEMKYEANQSHPKQRTHEKHLAHIRDFLKPCFFVSVSKFAAGSYKTIQT